MHKRVRQGARQVGRLEPELQPATRRPLGPMRQLSPKERRRWQSTTLATPRRRYGADARLLFKLEDLVFGPARTLPKFRARELIARTPYQSWEQAAYLKARQWRPREPDPVPAPSSAHRLRRVPAVLVAAGAETGLELPAQRRHRGSRRVRVRGTGRRASGVGDHSIPLGGRGRLRVLRFAGRHVP